MKLFLKEKQLTKSEVYSIVETAKKAYGTEKAPQIQGFEGFFLWSPPDLYITGKVESLLLCALEFKSEVTDAIKKFIAGEWGNVSPDEDDLNVEQRDMFGLNKWIIGRYDTSAGELVIETFYNLGLIYLAGEDIESVREEQKATAASL